MINPSPFLRCALLLDAVVSGVSALALTFDATALASLFSLPEALLRESGVFLIAYTMFVGWLGSRVVMHRGLVTLVIAGNVAWTIASIALLLSGAVSPNLAGEVVIAAQAIGTGLFAELQYIGLRRSAGEAAA